MSEEEKNNSGADICCPSAPRWEGDLVGCGSRNLTDADDEGFYDCIDCGLFFKADAA